jgi:hypothetical protein
LPGTHRAPRLTPVVRHLQVLAGIPQTASTIIPITGWSYYWTFSVDCAESALPFCVSCCSLAHPCSTPTPYVPPLVASLPRARLNLISPTLLESFAPYLDSSFEVLCSDWRLGWSAISKGI